MRDAAKIKRQRQIESAAYAVLEEKGYAGTSMLAIARRARASNETLYNWYGDKTGLFRALVARNAAEVKTMLEDRIAAGGNALQTLQTLGPLLLGVLTGARAVALNRAAAADPSGELGAAIAAEGRETVAPLVARVFDQARSQGHLAFTDLNAATEVYLNLLIGDLQIRRVIGRLAEPNEAERKRRSAKAIRLLLKLFGEAPNAASAP